MFCVSICEGIRSFTANSSSGRLSLVRPKLKQASAYYLVFTILPRKQSFGLSLLLSHSWLSLVLDLALHLAQMVL